MIFTLILNNFSYYYFQGYKKDLGLFDVFLCIPNLFDPRYKIMKELLYEKMIEEFSNREDVFVEKMTRIIEQDDVFYCIIFPSY